MIRRSADRVVALLSLGGLFVITLGPFPQPDLPGRWELLPHVVAYGAATLIALTLTHRGRAGILPAIVAAVAASLIVLGATLEVAQRAVDRDVEMADVVANALGVLAAVVAWSLVRRWRGAAPDGER